MLTFDSVIPQPVRPPACAGSWYPGTATALAAEIDRYCARVAVRVEGDLVGLISPHAGLVYSGPVAAHGYAQLRGRAYTAVILLGPSHYEGFEGAAVFPRGAFATPLGHAIVAEELADAIMAATPLARDRRSAHQREHSIEMQLLFVQRFLPSAAIVPVLLGPHTRPVAAELGRALARVAAGGNVLLVASSDLSHYHDAGRAARLDGVVTDAIAAFDIDALEDALEREPGHACGGGPIAVVMRAARELGARDARVLCYRDSGDVSGDKGAVVGYASAAVGTFEGTSQPTVSTGG